MDEVRRWVERRKEDLKKDEKKRKQEKTEKKEKHELVPISPREISEPKLPQLSNSEPHDQMDLEPVTSEEEEEEPKNNNSGIDALMK